MVHHRAPRHAQREQRSAASTAAVPTKEEVPEQAASVGDEATVKSEATRSVVCRFLREKSDAIRSHSCRVIGCTESLRGKGMGRHCLCEAHKDGKAVESGGSMFAFCRRGSHFCPWNAFQGSSPADGRISDRPWLLQEELGGLALRRCCNSCRLKRRIHRARALGQHLVIKQVVPASPLPFTADSKVEPAALLPIRTAIKRHVRSRAAARPSYESQSDEEEGDMSSAASTGSPLRPTRRSSRLLSSSSSKDKGRRMYCSSSDDEEEETDGSDESIEGYHGSSRRCSGAPAGPAARQPRVPAAKRCRGSGSSVSYASPPSSSTAPFPPPTAKEEPSTVTLTETHAAPTASECLAPSPDYMLQLDDDLGLLRLSPLSLYDDFMPEDFPKQPWLLDVTPFI